MTMRAEILAWLVLSLGVSATGWWLASTRLEQELAARPRLAIVDYEPGLKALAEGADPRVLEPRIAAFKADVKRLKEAGFVVLHGWAIDAGPEDLYLRPSFGDVPRPAIAPGR